MKKSIVKNRKHQLRNKRFFLLSLVVSSFLITCSLGLSYWLFLYPRSYVSPLPVVIQKISVSGKPSQTISSQQELVQDLEESKIHYTKISKSNSDTFVISLDNNGDVIVDGSKNISLQIASLQLIVNRLTMEGKRFSRLDVRDEKPVITF